MSATPCSECGRYIYMDEGLWHDTDGGLHTCGPMFQRGDLVWCRTEDKREWRRGIVTEVFVAPVTGKAVVVMGGDGYYIEDVMPDTGQTRPDVERASVPEPQSLRA